MRKVRRWGRVILPGYILWMQLYLRGVLMFIARFDVAGALDTRY
jgi:hypothetical protein